MWKNSKIDIDLIYVGLRLVRVAAEDLQFPWVIIGT